MLTGLEILLARMKDYPEEFTNPSGKWRILIKEILPYLDKDEMVALEYGIKDAMRDKFNEDVLTTLAGFGVQEPEQKQSRLTSPAQMKNEALGMLNSAFDEEYTKYNAQQNMAAQQRDQFKNMAGLQNQAFNPYNAFKP